MSELKATRPRSVVAASAVLLLLVAAGGCNRSTDRTVTPKSTATSAVPSPSDSAEGSAEVPTLASGEASASSVDSESPSAAAATPTAPATPDAVASELDQIQQLIDDINSSITGSDSSGGE